MGHIRLARWADVLLIAPVTANLMAKLAHGIADDLLTTLYQAGTKKVLLAPAMNPEMWSSVATQRNKALLSSCHFIGPAVGEMACGEQGAGRLVEPEHIVQAVYALSQGKDLQGQHWVINAGATHEYWDKIRYLSNPASGKTGFALAACAAARGAKVDLIAGPQTPQSTPWQVQRHDVISAADMLQLCQQHAQHADVFIASAAVGDFHFKERMSQKMKRAHTTAIQPELLNNPDIVKSIAQMAQRPNKVIAFAAETENHQQYAQQKRQDKQVDAIFANDVSNMAANDTQGLWLTAHQCESVAKMPKWQFAHWLIDAVLKL